MRTSRIHNAFGTIFEDFLRIAEVNGTKLEGSRLRG